MVDPIGRSFCMLNLLMGLSEDILTTYYARIDQVPLKKHLFQSEAKKNMSQLERREQDCSSINLSVSERQCLMRWTFSERYLGPNRTRLAYV